MRKIQSKKLYRYLRLKGVLNQDPKTIALVKRQYRTEYKRHKARDYRKTRNEIRFYVTKQEYSDIQRYCKKHKMNATELAKDVLLTQSIKNDLLASKQVLLPIAKRLGLIINQLSTEASSQKTRTALLELESHLLKHL